MSGREQERVTLRIIPSDPAGGRFFDIVQERRRAESAVHEGLELWPRYQFQINPEGRRMRKLADLAGKALAFIDAHKSEAAAVAAYVASLPMPAPYHQVATLISVIAAAVAGTKYGR